MWWSEPALSNVLRLHISAIVTHHLGRDHPWGHCCEPVERSQEIKGQMRSTLFYRKLIDGHLKFI